MKCTITVTALRSCGFDQKLEIKLMPRIIVMGELYLCRIKVDFIEYLSCIITIIIIQ